MRRHGHPFQKLGSKQKWHKEKMNSWNKPELEDTQPRNRTVLPAELATEKNASELEARQIASEMPG